MLTLYRIAMTLGLPLLAANTLLNPRQRRKGALLQRLGIGAVGPDRPDPATCSDEVWLDYILNVPNPVGPVEERWWHARGCGTWFTHWRHTITHEVSEGPDG